MHARVLTGNFQSETGSATDDRSSTSSVTERTSDSNDFSIGVSYIRDGVPKTRSLKRTKNTASLLIVHSICGIPKVPCT